MTLELNGARTAEVVPTEASGPEPARVDAGFEDTADTMPGAGRRCTPSFPEYVGGSLRGAGIDCGTLIGSDSTSTAESTVGASATPPTTLALSAGASAATRPAKSWPSLEMP